LTLNHTNNANLLCLDQFGHKQMSNYEQKKSNA